MRGKLSAIVGCVLLSVCVLGGPVEAGRGVSSLNEGWQLYLGEFRANVDVVRQLQGMSKQPVTLPHSWNANFINRLAEGEPFYKGEGGYIRRLEADELDAGERQFLRFEGALAHTEVYLNNKRVGTHAGGYSAFAFEITDHIKPDGDNWLIVRVNNENNQDIVPVADDLFTRFGGLYRPVSLITTDAICIAVTDYASPGVYLTQTDVSDDRAEVGVRVKVDNGRVGDGADKVTASIRVLDAMGKPVVEQVASDRATRGKISTIATTIEMDDPHLWHGRKDPYLYSVVVELRDGDRVLDRVTQPLGLRYFEVTQDEGLILNGEPYPLYGVCRHQEWEYEGSALTDAHHRRDIELIYELGARGLRLAHYQQAETMYRLCDEKGLIVWAEPPIVGQFPEDNDKFVANCRQQLTELILQNYNHPSIFFWGLFNESEIGSGQIKALHELAKSLDPHRLTTFADNRSPSGRHAHTDLVAWNRYPRWYGGGSMRNTGDSVREKMPDAIYGVSEYGAGAYIGHQTQDPQQPHPKLPNLFPEQYQALYHELAWPELQDSQVWCSFVWNMFDFGWPGVTRGGRMNLNHKGLITYDRNVKKDAFFYYKANWSDQPVLHLTSKRHVERTNATTQVKVYSNVGSPTLSVNGRDYGTTDGEHHVYIWQGVELSPGENLVIVTVEHAGQLHRDTVSWHLSAR